MTFAEKLGISEIVQKIVNLNDGKTGIYLTSKHPIMTVHDRVIQKSKDKMIIIANLSGQVQFELEKITPKYDKDFGKTGEYRLISLKEGDKEVYRFPAKELKSRVL